MRTRDTAVQTAESVTEGHPDKVADYIADSILDGHLARDPYARVACEVLCKSGTVVVAGKISSKTDVDLDAVVRNAIGEVGYSDPLETFSAERVRIEYLLTRQAAEISQGVDSGENGQLGAGDQGIMIGNATDETPELMPLPIFLAHRLAEALAADRKQERVSWLRPDGKTQVSVRYEDGKPVAVTDVIVSAQHSPTVDSDTLGAYVTEDLIPKVLGAWRASRTRVHVNPSGSFVHGGPSVDCGLTGRKNMVDSYGPLVPHGGGSFSGKDATKVDRSAAYFSRYVARQLVRDGLAKRALLRVAYAIGMAKPVELDVDTFGGDKRAALDRVRQFDFRPSAMIERLGLRQPIYRRTTNYGHFGRPGLPWEE